MLARSINDQMFLGICEEESALTSELHAFSLSHKSASTVYNSLQHDEIHVFANQLKTNDISGEVYFAKVIYH